MTFVFIALAIYAIAWCGLALSDRRGWNGVDDDGVLGVPASESYEQRQAA